MEAMTARRSFCDASTSENVQDPKLYKCRLAKFYAFMKT